MIDWLMDHPFRMVGIGTFIFMFLLYKDVYKWKKHQRHIKDIEERKRKKAMK